MIRNLYNELSRMNLQYHELADMDENKIFLTATALIPEGIEEAIQIKRIAERYQFCALWDGENIEILHCSKTT